VLIFKDRLRPRIAITFIVCRLRHPNLRTPSESQKLD
jgi:hypothetical protein